MATRCLGAAKPEERESWIHGERKEKKQGGPRLGRSLPPALPESRPRDSWSWSLILYLPRPDHGQGAVGSRCQHVGQYLEFLRPVGNKLL